MTKELTRIQVKKLAHEAEKLFEGFYLHKDYSSGIKYYAEKKIIELNLTNVSEEHLQVQLTANNSGVVVFGDIQLNLE